MGAGENETQNQRSTNADVIVIFCRLRKYTPISIKETTQVERNKEAHIISLARKVKDEENTLKIEMYL